MKKFLVTISSDPKPLLNFEYFGDNKKVHIFYVYINGQKAIRTTFNSKINRNKIKNNNLFSIEIPKKYLNKLINNIHVYDESQLVNNSFVLSFADSIFLKFISITDHEIAWKISGRWGGELLVQLSVDGSVEASQTVVISDNIYNHASEIELEIKFDIRSFVNDGMLHVFQLLIPDELRGLYSDVVVERMPKYKCAIDSINYKSFSGWVFREGLEIPLSLIVQQDRRTSRIINADALRLDVADVHDRRSANVGFIIELAEWDVYTEIVIRDTETNLALLFVQIFDNSEILPTLITESKRLGEVRLMLPLVNRVTTDIEQTTVRHRYEILPTKINATAPIGLSVIIPIYEGANETIECIESVLRSSNKICYEIIIVNDNSPNAVILEYLKYLAGVTSVEIKIINLVENGGFSNSVNIGMLCAKRKDVVLLNSDTIVSDGWLDQLMSVAAQDSLIGTITPLSNNAEIATWPSLDWAWKLGDNDVELITVINRFAKETNDTRFVDAPVAVGFCMFIRRSCLDEVGLFDEKKWGRGYGEEVDFCLKAREIGWRHVIATGLFVVHRGGISFGEEKHNLIAKNTKIINDSYPYYEEKIQRYFQKDPIENHRRNIVLKFLQKEFVDSILINITHNYGGGTRRYIDLENSRAKSNNIVPIDLEFSENSDCVLRINFSNTVLEKFSFFKGKNYIAFSYSFEQLSILKQVLFNLPVSSMVIHTPLGVPHEFLASLVEHFTAEIVVHDYSWICPRVTLSQDKGKYCREPAANACNECVRINQPHPALHAHWSSSAKNIVEYRNSLGGILRAADRVCFATNDVMNRMNKYAPDINYQFKNFEEVDPWAGPSIRKLSEMLFVKKSHEPTRVALFGLISDIKGYFSLIACAEWAEDNKLPIEFVVFGHTLDDSAFIRFKNVKILGRYKEEELFKLVPSFRPHVAFFPFQIPETYSFALTLAFYFGLWPIVPDLGGPAERVRERRFGTLYKLDTAPSAICELILSSTNGQDDTLSLRDI